ncbi:MAG TPA: four helix bundle protein [Pyrinomonadaceae bacterium]|nr:four helix bundle protein [Pyrinomonadaceae bacterium]
MAKIERFEDIESWKLAREAVNLVYDATNGERFGRDFALCNQIRRAAISIMSNIAEGFERNGNKEFLQFLAVAKGSCGEVRSQLYIALDQGYLGKETFGEISETLLTTSRLISGIMKYLRQSEHRGSKFQ